MSTDVQEWKKFAIALPVLGIASLFAPQCGELIRQTHVRSQMNGSNLVRYLPREGDMITWCAQNEGLGDTYYDAYIKQMRRINPAAGSISPDNKLYTGAPVFVLDWNRDNHVDCSPRQ